MILWLELWLTGGPFLRIPTFATLLLLLFLVCGCMITMYVYDSCIQLCLRWDLGHEENPAGKKTSSLVNEIRTVDHSIKLQRHSHGFLLP